MNTPYDKVREGLIGNKHVLIQGPIKPISVVMEYFANRRIIYASPIKALANQKFHDFKEQFPESSIGIYTGDVQNNIEIADILICTTEILMNMLFAEQIKHISCIVLDDIHYLFDKERGHVWQQAIILLPPNIQLLMMSAVLEDPTSLAQWIETTTQRPVQICNMKSRVPIHHSYYVAVREPVIEIMNKSKNKMNNQIKEYMNQCVPILSNNGAFNEKTYDYVNYMLNQLNTYQSYTNRKWVLNQLLRHLIRLNKLPIVFFIFSRKYVENMANDVSVVLDSNPDSNPDPIDTDIQRLLLPLSNYNQLIELSEYKKLVRLLRRGIAYHHSGMLPILRELVEYFIKTNRIQILFATESFATNMDCSIKTVVFGSLTKHDKHGWRNLTLHEYNQMICRADNVVHCNNLFALPSLSEYRQIVSTTTTPPPIPQYTIKDSLILGMLLKETTITVNSMTSIINKTMGYAKKDREYQQLKIREALLSEHVMHKLPTPYSALEQYHQWMLLPVTKKLVQNIKNWKEQYHMGSRDYAMYCNWLNIRNQLNSREGVEEVEGLQRTLKKWVESGIVKYNEDDKSWTLNKREYGIFGEIIIPHFYSAWKQMTLQEWAGILSCFTSLKRDEMVRPRKTLQNENIRSCIVNLDSEREREWMLDWVDDVMEWCDCTSEKECTDFIKRLNSLGDFTKVLLKIMAITREIASWDAECVVILSKLPALLFKHVITSKSLFVG